MQHYDIVPTVWNSKLECVMPKLTGYFVSSFDGSKYPNDLYAPHGLGGLKQFVRKTSEGTIVEMWDDLPAEGYPYGFESLPKGMDVQDFMDACSEDPENTLLIHNMCYGGNYTLTNVETTGINPKGEPFPAFKMVKTGEDVYKTIADVVADKFPGMYIDLEKYNNFFARYIKPWSVDNGLNTRKFPMPFERIVKLSLLPKEKYNMDLVVSSFLSIGIFDEDYAKYIIESCIENAEIKQSDSSSYIRTVISKNPEKHQEYKSGKTNLLNMFFGEVMKLLPDKNVDKGELRQQIEQILNE